MISFRYPWHLVTRFFKTLFSQPLSPEEQRRVNRALRRNEVALFWEQQAIDQRHAYEVAERVRASLGDREDALAAALLHDVGKRHSRLGPLGRSLATIADAIGAPLPERWERYRNHGALGAADLESVGARPTAVAFAAGRESGDAEVWATLVAADDGRLKGPAKLDAGNSMPPTVNT